MATIVTFIYILPQWKTKKVPTNYTLWDSIGSPEKKEVVVAFADFCGINILPVVNFEVST